jgi:hypothetical protein
MQIRERDHYLQHYDAVFERAEWNAIKKIFSLTRDLVAKEVNNIVYIYCQDSEVPVMTFYIQG